MFAILPAEVTIVNDTRLATIFSGSVTLASSLVELAFAALAFVTFPGRAKRAVAFSTATAIALAMPLLTIPARPGKPVLANRHGPHHQCSGRMPPHTAHTWGHIRHSDTPMVAECTHDCTNLARNPRPIRRRDHAPPAVVLP